MLVCLLGNTDLELPSFSESSHGDFRRLLVEEEGLLRVLEGRHRPKPDTRLLRLLRLLLVVCCSAADDDADVQHLRETA